MSIVDSFNISNLKRFCCDTSGNFSAVAGVSMFAILMTGGFVVDHTRLTQASADLQSFTDAGVVAASSDPTFTLAEREAIIQNLFETQSYGSGELNDLKYNLTTDNENQNINVKLVASAQVPLLFNGFFGDRTQISTVSEATTDNRTVELALVLDISTSMNDSRLNEMKLAASGFVEELSLIHI